jgi:hypothetical protein
MTRELIINGQKADIGNATIDFVFQKGAVGEFATKGGGTQTIKLPITQANREIFTNVDILEAESLAGYTVYGVHYYEDGFLFFADGILRILQVTDTIECGLVWGLSTVLNKLKQLRMENVPLGFYRAIPLEPISEDLYAFAESCYKEQINTAGTATDRFFTSIETSNSSAYWRDTAVPIGVDCNTVIAAALNAIGVAEVTPNSNLVADLDESIMLETRKKATRRDFKLRIKSSATVPARRYAFEGNNTVEYGRIINDTPAQYQVAEPRFPQVDNPSVYTELRDYYIPVDGYYDMIGTIDYVTGYEAANFMFWEKDIPLFIGSGGSERIIKTSKPDLSDLNPLVFGDSIYRLWNVPFDEGTLNINEVRIYLKKGRYGLWVIAPGTASAPAYPGDLGSYEISADILITRSDKDEIEVDDEQICYLDKNFMFDDLTAADVFKDILKAFGAYAEWDIALDALVIFGFNDIAAATASALDWSDKVLGKAKSLKYNLDLPEGLLVSWAKEAQYNGDKDLLFTIKSNEAGQVDYCKNTMLSACNGLIDDAYSGFTMAHPLLVTNNAGRDNDLSVRKVTAYDSHIKLAKIVEQFGTGSDKTIKYYYNQGGGVAISIDDFVVDQSIFIEMTDAFFDYNDSTNGIGKYFTALLASLEQLVYIEMPMYLQPKDVANLQLRVPIYLRQYGAYFAIEKIKYIQGGTSTVELLKINL